MDVVLDSLMEFGRKRNQELRAMKYNEKDLEITETFHENESDAKNIRDKYLDISLF